MPKPSSAELGSVDANDNSTKGISDSTKPKPKLATNPSAKSVETTPTPKVKKSWKKVVSYSGDSAKRTPTFKLSGSESRLKYSQTGGEYATTYVYIVKKGDSLQKSGGFPEVTIQGDKSDETMLVKDAGEYYFDINSNSANWKVTIEEYK